MLNTSTFLNSVSAVLSLINSEVHSRTKDNLLDLFPALGAISAFQQNSNINLYFKLLYFPSRIVEIS